VRAWGGGGGGWWGGGGGGGVWGGGWGGGGGATSIQGELGFYLRIYAWETIGRAPRSDGFSLNTRDVSQWYIWAAGATILKLAANRDVDTNRENSKA